MADRFHLHQNLGARLEPVLVRKQRSWRHAATALAAAAAGPSDVPTAPPEPRQPTRSERERLERRARRQERSEAVIAGVQQGLPFRAIVRTQGRARSTVSRCGQAAPFPEQAPRPRLTHLTAAEPYRRARWNAGEQHAAMLWRELRAQGYPGAASSLRVWVGRWRGGPPKRGRRLGAAPQAKAPLTGPLDTPRKTRWLLLQPAEDRAATEQAYGATLLAVCPQIAQAHALALRGVALRRERDGAAVEGWLVEAERSGSSERRAFARGIRREREAVDAALEVEGSQGQTEGQVKRVKCLTRQMYGRAGFALLRQRVLHPA